MILEELLYEQDSLNEFKNQFDLSYQSLLKDLPSIWCYFNRMRHELHIPSPSPIIEIVKLFLRLNEIRVTFDLGYNDFLELNQLDIEIRTIYDMLNIPNDISLKQLISIINPKRLSTLGLGKNSKLERRLVEFNLK